MDSKVTIDYQRIGNLPPNFTKKDKSYLTKFRPIFIVLGLSLLLFILYRVGFQTVVETISRIGWGFLAIIFLNGSRHFLRALGIFLAIPNRQSSFKFRDALATRLGGEAVGVLTFTGMMASETTKTVLLKKKLSVSGGLTAIVLDNLVYNFSVLIFILSGASLMLYLTIGENIVLAGVLVIIATAMMIGLIGLILLAIYRVKPMTYLLNHYSEKSRFPKFISRRSLYFYEIETNIFHSVENHRAKLGLMFAINLFIHLVSIAEVYVTLYLIGVTPHLTTAYIIESLTKVVTFTFSFMPGNLGVYEGGAVVILQMLGYSSVIGVSLALARRGSTLFWTLIGVLILSWQWLFNSLKQNRKKSTGKLISFDILPMLRNDFDKKNSDRRQQKDMDNSTFVEEN